MAPSNLQHRRTHNLLLVSKLLNQRDTASPFTLILDSLEQSGKPLVTEYVKRAQAAKVQVIFVSFETLKKPRDVDVFVEAWSQSVQSWQAEVGGHLKADPKQRTLLIFDSLNTLSGTEAANLPGILSSFISSTTSLLAVYHTDVPGSPQENAYAPQPLTLLKYLATTIFITHAFHHVLARKAARERSHVAPSFGLREGVEGALQSLGANGSEGLVLEMEHRRRSGRGVREWYFLPLAQSFAKGREAVMLLEDHPEYRSLGPSSDLATVGNETEGQATFELGLTEKQRQDRDGVVLPYFDAQKGGGEGGRILYDMGSEDDFDEEEDEI